jgi:hypothetical protein
MQDNPFAPPAAAADSSAESGLVFSPEGASVVASLAAWMRGLSIFLYLALAFILAFIAVLHCAYSAADAPDRPTPVVGFLVLGVCIGAAARWLRGAAEGFERGVMIDDETTLGQGFRNLRAYLILVGIGSILSLLDTLLEAGEVM